MDVCLRVKYMIAKKNNHFLPNFTPKTIDIDLDYMGQGRQTITL